MLRFWDDLNLISITYERFSVDVTFCKYCTTHMNREMPKYRNCSYAKLQHDPRVFFWMLFFQYHHSGLEFHLRSFRFWSTKRSSIMYSAWILSFNDIPNHFAKMESFVFILFLVTNVRATKWWWRQSTTNRANEKMRLSWRWSQGQLYKYRVRQISCWDKIFVGKIKIWTSSTVCANLFRVTWTNDFPFHFIFHSKAEFWSNAYFI